MALHQSRSAAVNRAVAGPPPDPVLTRRTSGSGRHVPDYSAKQVSFVSSGTAEADAAMAKLRLRYGDTGLHSAEVVVALGGDGLMLQTLHKVMDRRIPVFGMNCGSVGFLMNDYTDDRLLERLAAAKPTRIAPLAMHVTDVTGAEYDALALNEVSLFRTTYQAVKVEIDVDGRRQMDELICDGVLLSTPAGSTAYNLSAHGPILPINSPLLALTPISPFRPRRWRGAILGNSAVVTFRARETEKRPVSAVADNVEFKNVAVVVVREARDHQVTLLFDPGTGLEERILSEQFRY
ncbi:MAG: NAD kinase [Devosia nanyangense]|uniref:NAD kinase n=1 Tax=Devosia nanyangense TaxID=1228055 RepID=A0A933NWX7_9HYPH|nr:NAD kinase [Devosia nanyangense]